MISNSKLPCSRGFAALLPLFAALATASGQQAGATYTPEQLHRHFQNVAEDYAIRSSAGALKLREQPLMHWQNTVRQQEQGALYMWSRAGRPQVLASIFTYQEGDRVRCRHEMISLSESSLKAELGSTPVWAPKQAGVEWLHFDSVAAPAESKARRMTQMRSIARELSGTLKIGDQKPANLELIPQPLVRYDAAAAGVIDGAIFSMAVVTDPEIFLLVEAKKSGGGPAAWHYAAARSHFNELQLRRGNEVVWRAPDVAELASTQFGQFPWVNQPYFIFFPPRPLPPPEELR